MFPRPLEVEPKKTERGFKVIHHLSYLTKNDYIDDGLCLVYYRNFDEAISMVQPLSRGAYLSKSDSDCCLYGRGISNLSVSNLITVTILKSVYSFDVRYHVLHLRISLRFQSRSWASTLSLGKYYII